MQDERLRELTASEPLTLEEEYNMQRTRLSFIKCRRKIDFSVLKETWQNDEDKLTFIILARVSGDELDQLVIPTDQNIIDDALKPPGPIIAPSDSRLASLSMIGDVNIFFKGSIPETQSQMNDEDLEFESELEIMIAGMHEPFCCFVTHTQCFYCSTAQNRHIAAKALHKKPYNSCSDMQQVTQVVYFDPALALSNLRYLQD